MLYREIIAVCSQIHTKHTTTLCGQNVEFWNAQSAGTVHVATNHLQVQRLNGKDAIKHNYIYCTATHC